MLQIWIVPDANGLPPRYAEKSLAGAPAGKLALVASRDGREGSMSIHQDADLWHARLDRAQRAAHRLAAGRHAWVHVAEGEVTVNGTALSGGDAVGLDGEAAIEIAAAKPSQILLFDLA
jgi:redox-sensitive bicupin YhaK (pirin superfamily)